MSRRLDTGAERVLREIDALAADVAEQIDNVPWARLDATATLLKRASVRLSDLRSILHEKIQQRPLKGAPR